LPVDYLEQETGVLLVLVQDVYVCTRGRNQPGLWVEIHQGSKITPKVAICLFCFIELRKNILL